MNEIELAFHELFFGSGFWLGFLLLITICVVVSYKIKYSGVIFVVVLIFLAMEYNENLVETSYKLWSVILCFVAVLFIGTSTYLTSRG